MDVALLARAISQVPLICGHSGGDWELGVRAVRRHENVYIEFSGSDPHSGQVDYTVGDWERPAGLGRTWPVAFLLDRTVQSPRRRPDARPTLQVFGGNLGAGSPRRSFNRRDMLSNVNQRDPSPARCDSAHCRVGRTESRLVSVRSTNFKSHPPS